MTDERDDAGRGVLLRFDPCRRRHASKPKPAERDAFETLHAAIVNALARHDARTLAAELDDEPPSA